MEIIWLILILTVVFTVGVIIFELQANRRRDAAWENLAERFGLQYQPRRILQQPAVSGIFRGRPLILESVLRNYGRSQTSYTRIRVGLQSQALLSLKLDERGFWNRLTGGRSLELGDIDFDKRFLLRGEPESSVHQLFSGISLRQQVMQAPQLTIELKGGELVYERRGREADENRLLQLIDVLNTLAGGIERL